MASRASIRVCLLLMNKSLRMLRASLGEMTCFLRTGCMVYDCPGGVVGAGALLACCSYHLGLGPGVVVFSHDCYGGG